MRKSFLYLIIFFILFTLTLYSQESGDDESEELLFPMEVELFSGSFGESLVPLSPLLGELMPLYPGVDESTLYSLSLNFLQGKREALLYGPVKHLLIEKASVLDEVNRSGLIIGRPRINGNIAEVSYLFKSEEEVQGVLYWLFEEKWVLEDFDLIRN